MVQAALQKVPVIRILLPFLLGIISSYYSSGTLVIPLVLLALAIICFGFLTFCARRSVEVSLKLRHFYIVPISVIAISLGMVAEIIGRPLEMPLPDVNGHAIVGRVEQTRFNGTSQSIYLTLLRSNSTVWCGNPGRRSSRESTRALLCPKTAHRAQRSSMRYAQSCPIA